MKLVYIFLLLVIFQIFPNPANAGLFDKSQSSSSGTADSQSAINDIPVRDAAFKIIERRKIEAWELIRE